MRTLVYDPGADAAERYPDITIRRAELPFAHAAYLPRRGLILINRALSRRGWKCALAHELVHLDEGHPQAGSDVLEIRQEAATDRETARRLITLDALADALRWALGPDEVADELDVEGAVVRNRIRHLTDAEKTYIERRLGDSRSIA